MSKQAPAWKRSLQQILERNASSLDARNIAFSTAIDSQPYTRYIVHRGFLGGEDSPSAVILSTTDKRMQKVHHIERSTSSSPGGAPFEAVYWTSGTGDQLRVRGRVHLFPSTSAAPPTSLLPSATHSFEAERKKQFNNLSHHLRATFARPVPGSPIASAEQAREWPEDLPSFEELDKKEAEGEGEKDRKAVEEAYANFVLVLLEPTFVDHSNLNAKPNVRTQHTLHDGEWTVQPVVP